MATGHGPGNATGLGVTTIAPIRSAPNGAGVLVVGTGGISPSVKPLPGPYGLSTCPEADAYWYRGDRNAPDAVGSTFTWSLRWIPLRGLATDGATLAARKTSLVPFWVKFNLRLAVFGDAPGEPARPSDFR